MAAALSGLAASIRACVDSETFDLAGQSAATITSTFTAAFADPLPLDHMIRLTFVTGAGKLARSRYDDGAARAVMSALRSSGYDEDKGASCVVECGGSFKSQHDTGKNLYTVVVFPKIAGGGGAVGEDLTGGVAGMTVGDADGGGSGDGTLRFEKDSPEHMCAVSSMNVFERMLNSKCPSWTQKKGCLNALSHVREEITTYEEKLMKGEPLTDPEQDFYDSVSADDLAAKEALVKKEMHDQVESGRLTKIEQTKLLNQVEEKIASLAKDLELAEKEQKPKRAEKIGEAKTKAEARRKMLENIHPQSPHPLRHEAEISKLRNEMKPLLKLEDSAKGRLLTVKETTTLARKDEILEQIEELEEKSRGWFEDDEAFADRVKASCAAYKSKAPKKSASKKTTAGSAAHGGGSYRATTTNKWVTPSASKKKTVTKAPAAKPSGGGVFAAMMDSDSDTD